MIERFNRISIRWRLALTSALLTFIILLGFALVVGELTAKRVRGSYENDVNANADRVSRLLLPNVRLGSSGPVVSLNNNLKELGSADGAVIRVFFDGSVLKQSDAQAPDLTTRDTDGDFRDGNETVNGYQVTTQHISYGSQITHGPQISVVLQYGKRLSETEVTVGKVWRFLLFGVLAGTGLALAAGLMFARRAMAPIAALTSTAGEIQRTRDPSRSVPIPDSDDEVAELARTLDGMLHALESSRQESAEHLARQRQFVADASHELRTPLTSVLANLEILSETLDGDHRDVADSALKSSRRMRRLVADLLLLARADSNRTVTHAPVDLQGVLYDVAGELGPIAQGHELVVDAEPAEVDGARDELHRLALNLMDNAIKHTPPGTRITAGVRVRDGRARLTIADNGPGVPPELRDRLFERFVRGAGDRGGSFGLGLSIVRAVAQSHGGSVELRQPAEDTGTVFVVDLPALAVPAHEAEAETAGHLWSTAKR